MRQGRLAVGQPEQRGAEGGEGPCRNSAAFSSGELSQNHRILKAGKDH